jgi:flagellin-specific chaperone FliS
MEQPETRPSYPASPGLRAYAQVAQATMGPRQASLLLHERLCRELMSAKHAYQQGRLDRMCRHIEKCLRVLIVLQSGVKPAPGEPGPLILSGFYLDLFQRVRMILRNPKVEDAFDGVISNLRVFCEKMRAAA